ncbi:Adenosine monophosphate-protein transferase SoFic [Acetobacteraceae bacterium EV16G]|uniref:Adenosine monophosphate-protein transferase SoFic n=1 Tax=Sorlinia euscelidii TaxID=3081148 RepID=A0ABU7U1Z4_9PROT
MSDKASNLSDAVTYHYGRFPPDSLDWEKLFRPMEEASRTLARYDAKMTGMVNAALLVAPLRAQDAVASSRMEGTIATIGEIYRLQADEDSGSRNPYKEARNDTIETYLYSRVMNEAQALLSQGSPLNEHLVRTAHQHLLSFGRGAAKNPGSYKTEQNFIGSERRGKISFVPARPDFVVPAMGELFKYINDPTISPILRTAIAHVEFEALHPFQDGNGRIGRMLITLMLWKLGVLEEPYFYVSGYFEDHRDEYIEKMRAVSKDGDWEGWIIFFLEALQEQAKANTKTVDSIFELYNLMRKAFREVLKTQYHDQVLDFVFSKPFFYNNTFIKTSKIPAATARVISKRLADANILRVVAAPSGRRAALYAFGPLLEILET